MGVDFNKMKQFMESAKSRQKSFGRSDGGVDWFTMKQDGSYEVRILDIPMLTTGAHWSILRGEGMRKGGSIKCPKIYDDSPCPVCEMVEMFSNSSNEEEQKQAKELRAKPRYPILLIDLNEEGSVPKPRVWEAPYQALEEIHRWGSNPKYGDITHPENGRNAEIVRTTVKKGSFEYAEFKIMPDPDKSSIDLQGVQIPDLRALFKPRSYEEIEYAMNYGEYPKTGTESFEEEEPAKPAAKANKFTKPTPKPYDKGLPAPKVAEEAREEPAPESAPVQAAPAAASKTSVTNLLKSRLANMKGKK